MKNVIVAGKSKILEMMGCHKKGPQFNWLKLLQGSMYLETITSDICKLVGDSLYQNSPIVDKLSSELINK